MTFPGIPTEANGRLVFVNQLNTTATLTGPNLNTLTKNPGDLLIAVAGEYQSNAATGAAFTGWAGGGLTWTEIVDGGASGTTENRVGVAYAWVVTGSETGNVTVTRSGTLVGDASMMVICIPGAHTTSAPVASAVAVATNGAADPGSLSPPWGAEDTLWVGVNGNGMTAITGTWTANNGAPTNYTDYVGTAPADTSTVGDFGLAMAFRQLNATSEDMGTFSQDTSNARSIALLIAVRPDPTLSGLGVAQGQSAQNITLGVPALLHSHYDGQAITGLANNDPVATWEDQTANNRDLTQGTAGNRPTYLTNGINGHPAVQFATDDFLATAAYGTNLNQPTTYFVVIQMDSLATDQNIIDGIDFTAGSRQNAYHYASTTDWAMYAGGSNHIAGGTPDTSMHVLTLTFNGNSSTLRVDGTQVAAGGGGLPGTAFQNGLRIGSDPSGASDLNARVGEIQVWDGEVTGTERSTIESNLASKWATSTATDLTGLNVAQAQAATLTGMTQVHTLAGLDVAQGQSSTNIGTMSGSSTLAGLNVAQAQAAVLTGMTQVHTLAGLGVAQGQSSTNISLAGASTLAGLNVAQVQASANIALTQTHVLAGLGVSQPQYYPGSWPPGWPTEWPGLILIQTHVLAGLGVAQTQSAPNVTLTVPSQAINVRPTMTIRMVGRRVMTMLVLIQPVPPVTTTPTLTGMGVAQGQSTTNITLVQQHTLAGLGVAQGQSTTNIALVQQHTLAGLGVTQGQDTADPTLAVAHNLAGLNVAQGQSVPNITLGLPGALSGLGVAQGQASTVVALTQLHVLAGLGIAQAQATADPTLAVAHNLAGLNVAQAQSAQNVALNIPLLGLGVAQGQSTTSITLVQQHTLAGLGVAQAQSVPQIPLGTMLVNMGVAQSQATTNIALVQVHVLAGLNVAQAQATADPTLERIFNLTGLNVAQAQAATIGRFQYNLLVTGVAQGQKMRQGVDAALVLTQLHVLAGLGVAQTQSVPQVGLSGAGTLGGLGVAQAQATQDPTLERMFNLLGLGVAQGQTTPNVLLGFGLLGLGVNQTSTATLMVLTQLHLLVGLGVLTPQQVTAIVLGVGALPLRRSVTGGLTGHIGGGDIAGPVGKGGGLVGHRGGGQL